VPGIFGPSLDSSDVERALLAHLRAWMPTTIPAILRIKDPEKERWPKGIRPIQTYDVSFATAVGERWPGSILPMLVAQSPGMTDDPTTNGDGTVDARYGVVLAAVAEGRTAEDTKELARAYAAAARLAIMQEPSLKAGTETPFAQGIKLGQELNSPVSRGVEAERTLRMVTVAYEIEVAGILDVSGGPLEPLEEPESEPEDWPKVKEGSVEIEQGADKVALLEEGGFFE
jgi:hypothetical protein